MAVYAWGANSHGQLGLGYESELCMSPQLLKNLSFQANQVRCVRGGGGHVLVLDSLGRVHACGWNNRGQLGLDSVEECHNEFQAIPIEFFGCVPVASIACGWDLSGCITVAKKLYVWGSNAFQQLGICQRGFNAVRRPLLVTLPRDDTPRRVSFGMRSCAILTEDYNVYIFGRLRLDDPTPSEICVTTTSMNRASVLKVMPSQPNEMRIVAVACGQHHVLMQLVDLEHGNTSRRVICLGDNKFGQSNGFYFEDNIKQIATGWTHNAVMLKDKRVYMWGRNCYGQLGIGSESECQAVPMQLKAADTLEPARVHLGCEHGLLRTADGAVYTWGWNEHGNCGNDNTDNVCSPTLVSLDAPCRLAGAGAGFCYAICESDESKAKE